MSSPERLLPNAVENAGAILRARVPWVVALVLVGIHALLTRSHDITAWYGSIGLSREGFLSGRVWQLITHGFVHGGWWHVLLNALFVLLLGSRIEHIVGSSVIWRVMVIGIVAGGIMHLLLGTGLLVGLSGACMALLLLLTTLSPQSRMMPLPVSARSLGIGMVVASLFLSLMNPHLRAPGFAPIGIQLERYGLGSWFQLGHACHLGGALAGWLYGRWILRPRVTLAGLRRDRVRRGMD